MIVTKQFAFEAAHKLDWYDGPCKNLHGHSYKLEVSVEGPLNENGIVMDFADLKGLVNEYVIEKLDHTTLNDTIPNPTAENISVWIWDQVEKGLLDYGVRLYEIRLWETETSSVVYRGD